MGTGGAESMYLDGYPSSSPGKLNPPSFPPISHLSTPLAPALHRPVPAAATVSGRE